MRIEVGLTGEERRLRDERAAERARGIHTTDIKHVIENQRGKRREVTSQIYEQTVGHMRKEDLGIRH